MPGFVFSLLNSLGTGGLDNLRTGGVSDLPFMVAVLRLFCLEAWDLEGIKLSTAAQAENHIKVLITFWIRNRRQLATRVLLHALGFISYLQTQKSYH
jgi:hypothetical protein